MTDVQANPGSRRSERYRRRLERELHAFRTMNGHLNTREILWAVLTIPGVALLCVIIAAKLQWLAGSAPLSITGALVFGAFVWWIGRRWISFAWLIVMALFCIAFESPPDFGIGPEEKKLGRQLKLEHAIAKREALLRAIDERAP